MGWFGKDDTPAAPVAPTQSGHTVESVRAQLDTIGRLRLQVCSPQMKALLTTIAWKGEPYLAFQAPNGKPSGAQLVKMASALDTAIQVVQAFIRHEQQVRPGDTAADDQLAKELAAIKQYAASLTAAADSTAFATAFGSDVNTALLQQLAKVM